MLDVVDDGRLETEQTAALCRRLAEESRTGCLHVAGRNTQTQVGRAYFADGSLYTATATAARARLGDRLVGGEHITPEQLTTALDYQRQHAADSRLGDVLVQLGLLQRDVLRRVVRDQILDSLTAMISWDAGVWRFVEGESVPEDVPLGLGVQDALMEASRRLGELSVITTQLGSLDAVVDFRTGGNESQLSLKPDEWAMLTQIDGHATVAEIAHRAGYGQLEAARIVYGLLAAGVVTLVPDEGPSAPDRATPPPAVGAPPPPAMQEASQIEGLRAELESLGLAEPRRRPDPQRLSAARDAEGAESGPPPGRDALGNVAGPLGDEAQPPPRPPRPPQPGEPGHSPPIPTSVEDEQGRSSRFSRWRRRR